MFIRKSPTRHALEIVALFLALAANGASPATANPTQVVSAGPHGAAMQPSGEMTCGAVNTDPGWRNQPKRQVMAATYSALRCEFYQLIGPHRHCLLVALQQAYFYHNAHPWPTGDPACHPYTDVERSAYAIDTLILYQPGLTDTMRSAILSALTPG